MAEETSMDASTIAVLLRRLEAVERSNRRLKALAACVGLALIAATLMGQVRPGSPTVEAQEFVVKDASGAVRARLGTSAGLVSLNLLHDAGRASLVVSANKAQGAHLALADTTGKIKGLLMLNEQAVGMYLSPVDATGAPRSPRAVFEVHTQGPGGFAVYDRNGHTRALVGAISEDGSSVAVIQDQNGTVTWRAP
jgi:hypothetical protein